MSIKEVFLSFLSQLGFRKSEQETSDEIFNHIASDICPNCKTEETLFVAARGGEAMNVRCSACDSLYWVSPIKQFGAYKIKE